MHDELGACLLQHSQLVLGLQKWLGLVPRLNGNGNNSGSLAAVYDAMASRWMSLVHVLLLQAWCLCFAEIAVGHTRTTNTAWFLAQTQTSEG